MKVLRFDLLRDVTQFGIKFSFHECQILNEGFQDSKIRSML